MSRTLKLIGLILGAGVMVLAETAESLPPRGAAAKVPLRLDSGEAARLLGGADGSSSATPAAAPSKSNARCHVCHMNYAQEALAVSHARVDLGCQDCHGPCNEHCSDEDNITPPTVLFPRAKIVPYCVKCHTEDKLAGVEKHKPALIASGQWQKVCTDCHDSHRLKVRTRRWNKETGQLISDDGVRMVREPKGKSDTSSKDKKD